MQLTLKISLMIFATLPFLASASDPRFEFGAVGSYCDLQSLQYRVSREEYWKLPGAVGGGESFDGDVRGVFSLHNVYANPVTLAVAPLVLPVHLRGKQKRMEVSLKRCRARIAEIVTLARGFPPSEFEVRANPLAGDVSGDFVLKEKWHHFSCITGFDSGGDHPTRPIALLHKFTDPKSERVSDTEELFARKCATLRGRCLTNATGPSRDSRLEEIRKEEMAAACF